MMKKVVLTVLAASGIVASAAVLAGRQEPSAVPAIPTAPAYSVYLPNPELTPGDTLPVTKDLLCVRGYAKSVRNVPSSEKSKVYLEYHMLTHKAGAFEVDHLISLELGGSNDIKNLWPELYELNYQGSDIGAHTKDRLENFLHAQVCTGNMTLVQAQTEIRIDWIASYLKRIGNLPAFPFRRGEIEKP